jgi:GTP1/Obg family GTP-binding protein
MSIDLMEALVSSLRKKQRLQDALNQWLRSNPRESARLDPEALADLSVVMLEIMGEDPIDQLHDMANAMKGVIDWLDNHKAEKKQWLKDKARLEEALHGVERTGDIAERIVYEWLKDIPTWPPNPRADHIKRLTKLVRGRVQALQREIKDLQKSNKTLRQKRISPNTDERLKSMHDVVNMLATEQYGISRLNWPGWLKEKLEKNCTQQGHGREHLKHLGEQEDQ